MLTLIWTAGISIVNTLTPMNTCSEATEKAAVIKASDLLETEGCDAEYKNVIFIIV